MVEVAQGLIEMVGGEGSDGTGVEFKYFCALQLGSKFHVWGPGSKEIRHLKMKIAEST